VRGVLCPSVIGRDNELEEIADALDRAAGSSRGTVLFLAGEAGIGKSRLAQEAIARAREGAFRVMSGRATIPHGTVAFRPLTEALFSYFRAQGPPDLPELAPFHGALARLVPEWRRSEAGGDDSIVVVAEAVVRLLGAVGQNGGCLLVLDDLHWADPETLSIVEYLAENLVSEPVVCVCTVRSEEPSAALRLARTLAARRAASTITLERLRPEQTTAMALACLSAHDLPDSVATLLAGKADGLPFFVEELLADAVGSGALHRNEAGWTAPGTLDPSVPPTFLDSVDSRLRTLGPAADVLVAAAVIGRRFDWTLLGAVTGLPDKEVLTALRAGVDAQLLVAEPSPTGSFLFRHSLTRDAVVQRLLPMEQALLARTAADAIEAAHPGLPDAWCDLCARLAERSGDAPRAAALLVESGRRSRSRGALASAEDAFSRALDLAHDVPPLAADAAEALCETLSLSGKVDQALDVGVRLFVALNALDAPADRLGRVHLWLARAAAGVGRWDLADDHVQQARACALEVDDPELSSPADAIGAAVALSRGDIERAHELAQRARTTAERLCLHDVTCEALEVIGRAARGQDLDKAEAAFGQALAVADEHGLEVWRVRALFELGTVDHFRELSGDRLTAARGLALSIGALATAAHIDLMEALRHLDRCELDEATASARLAGEVARRFRMQTLRAMTLIIEGAAIGYRGGHDEMEVFLDEAIALAGDELDIAGIAWTAARGVSSLIVENRAQALTELDAGMAVLRHGPSAQAPERGLWALVRAVEDIDGEAACAEVRASGALVHCLNQGFVQYGEAVLAGRTGDTEAAERLLAAGDVALAHANWFHQLARRLVAEAAIADGWGHPAAWLREALVCFEEHGQERLVTACRSLLGKAGAPVPRRRQHSPVPAALRQIGITEREHEVLALLAEGLANKEIAGRLFMSPRTVERHIANITVRTGLRTRSELVAFAARNASG
jgi:DNA-binding CsgD family transcriptional regulator/tetratricopeptide (TPR) repeat protein